MNKKDYKLVWSEEFDYEGKPDPTKWGYDVGNKWHNNELQAYTDRESNAYVRDGKLTITALREQEGGRDYTSARMTTYGKASWQYGYFEIRAKLPSGVGSWPALWFLPNDIREGVHWPLCGEIDMMEHTLLNKDVVVYSLHSQKHNHTRRDTVQYSTSVSVPGVTEEFHVYGTEWTKDYVEYFMDGKSVCIYRRTDDADDQTETSWPFDKPYFLIMNIAVGGFMGGPVVDADLPYTMEIDYIRVYQKEE